MWFLDLSNGSQLDFIVKQIMAHATTMPVAKVTGATIGVHLEDRHCPATPLHCSGHGKARREKVDKVRREAFIFRLLLSVLISLAKATISVAKDLLIVTTIQITCPTSRLISLRSLLLLGCHPFQQQGTKPCLLEGA